MNDKVLLYIVHACDVHDHNRVAHHYCKDPEEAQAIAELYCRFYGWVFMDYYLDNGTIKEEILK